MVPVGAGKAMTVLRVAPNTVAWQQGIRALLRPSEARALALRALTLHRVGVPTANAVGRALAGLVYIPDPGTADLWQSPAATLEHGGGDCEDLSIVAASALTALGVPVDVVIGDVWNGVAWSRHAWVEGDDGQGPFLLEATAGRVFRNTRPSSYRAITRAGTLRAAA